MSDSIHLRRFCRIALSERVPDESTVRKLTRRIGPETVHELTRALIDEGDAGEALPAAGGEDRLDGDRGRRKLSDRRRPRLGRREGAGRGRAASSPPWSASRARGCGIARARWAGGCARSARTIRRRTGEAKAEVLELTERDRRAARALGRARRSRLAARARARRARARRPGEAARGRAGWSELADRCEQGRLADPPARRGRADQGPAGLAVRPRRPPDPQGQARQAERVRVRHPALRGDREHQARRARTDPAAGHRGRATRARTRCCPRPSTELERLGLYRARSRSTAASTPARPTETLAELAPERVFISGRQQPGSRRTRRRLQRYRTGAEGRISHLKRRYGLDRSRLKGDEGQQIWTGWAILAYNLDTLAAPAG